MDREFFPQQVRRSFYGVEVQHIPRLREDVKVLVRYSKQARSYEESLRDMKIRITNGLEVPFETTATIHYVPGYRKIERQNRKRVARISADLQPGFSASNFIKGMQSDRLKTTNSLYPDITIFLATQEHFRPIILASLTAFIDLSLIMLKRNVQAQFLIPMVISLAFGVLLATFVTLIFVPLLYLTGEGIKFSFKKRNVNFDKSLLKT